MKQTAKTKIIASLLATTLLLSACGAGERLANVGKEPQMSRIENPVTQAGYQPVSLPMPSPKAEVRQANSLWSGERRGFFKDQRAADVGDLITVLIDIQDKAELDNRSTRTRNNTENVGINNLFGFESYAGKILPDAVDPANLVGAGSTSRSSGSGVIDREEKITLKLAAIVTQRMPNGNMVINGSQEVRVNFENRVLNVSGIIRPEDITSNNTISYEKVAEARIAYGGKGHMTDVQQPRYGQQVLDIIAPF